MEIWAAHVVNNGTHARRRAAQGWWEGARARHCASGTARGWGARVADVLLVLASVTDETQSQTGIVVAVDGK